MTPDERRRIRILIGRMIVGALAARDVGVNMRRDREAFDRACRIGFVRAWQYPVCLEVRG